VPEARLSSGDLDLIEQVPTATSDRIRRDALLQTAQKISWRTIFFHLDQRSRRQGGGRETRSRPAGAARTSMA